MLRSVALVRTDVSKELSASFIRATRIGELGTTLSLTSNLRTLRRNADILSRYYMDVGDHIHAPEALSSYKDGHGVSHLLHSNAAIVATIPA
jgi:hypothetical protein